MIGGVILIACGVAVGACAIGADAFAGWIIGRWRKRHLERLLEAGK